MPPEFGGLLALGKPGAAPLPAGPPEIEAPLEDEAEGGEHREQLLAVADDLMVAVKAGDREGVADAFEAAYSACGSKSGG